MHLIASNTSFKAKGYVISIFKPIDETRNLITAILLAMTILFTSLIALLLLINYSISKRVWVPFYKTLRNLGNYDINKEEPLQLSKTTIKEFQSLNEALDRMSVKIRRDYLNLKEFNENASHELQTPLAIIKSKIELLVQNEQMSGEEMQLIHSVNDAVTRMTKLNQGLLLISKIENNQFRMTDEVDLHLLVKNNLEHLDEIIRIKNINLSFNCDEPVKIMMNKTLSEILVSNLISNAIRHNIQDGQIVIHLDPESLNISNSGHPLTVPTQQLFQRFRKSDRSSESVGLGLAIVKQIVILYQMEIKYIYDNGFHSVNLTFHPENK